MASAFTARTSIDDAGLSQVLHGSRGPLHRWLVRKGAEMEAGARAKAGFRTGKLKASIDSDVGRSPTGLRLVVYADAQIPGNPGKSYALYHHEGTRPHTIGRRMVSTKGKTYTQVVKHRGTRGNPYLSSQLYRVRGG